MIRLVECIVRIGFSPCLGVVKYYNAAMDLFASDGWKPRYGFLAGSRLFSDGHSGWASKDCRYKLESVADFCR